MCALVRLHCTDFFVVDSSRRRSRARTSTHTNSRAPMHAIRHCLREFDACFPPMCLFVIVQNTVACQNCKCTPKKCLFKTCGKMKWYFLRFEGISVDTNSIVMHRQFISLKTKSVVILTNKTNSNPHARALLCNLKHPLNAIIINVFLSNIVNAFFTLTFDSVSTLLHID